MGLLLAAFPSGWPLIFWRFRVDFISFLPNSLLEIIVSIVVLLITKKLAAILNVNVSVSELSLVRDFTKLSLDSTSKRLDGEPQDVIVSAVKNDMTSRLNSLSGNILSSDRPVLKVLKRHLKDDQNKERFVNEALSTSRPVLKGKK